MCCRISDQLHPILDRVCVTLQDWVNNYSIMHRILSYQEYYIRKIVRTFQTGLREYCMVLHFVINFLEKSKNMKKVRGEKGFR